MAKFVRKFAVAGAVCLATVGGMANISSAGTEPLSVAAASVARDSTNQTEVSIHSSTPAKIDLGQYAVNLGNGITEDKNVPYCQIGNLPQETANIYFSTSSTTAGASQPFVLSTHGGGYLQNTLVGPNDNAYNLFTALMPQILAKGVTFMSINYPPGPAYKFPDPIYYENCALGFATVNLSPTAIDIEGDSAGAEISAFTTVTQGMKKFNQEPYSAVKVDKISGVVMISGFFDMKTIWKANRGMTRIINREFNGSSARVNGSPQTYAVAGKKLPPFEDFQGTDDGLVPMSQPVDFFKDVLLTKGNSRLLYTVPGTKHELAGATPAQVLTVETEEMSFLVQTLRLS